MSEKAIVLTGVGGQGVLIVAKILGDAAMASGLEVLQSEVHGMAQRGGVVESMIKIGDEITSPLIASASADVVLGFEPLETYRAIPYMNRETTVVTSTEPIFPFTVNIGQDRYPSMEKMLEEIRAASGRTYEIENVKLAEMAGNTVAANVVMVGALAATNVLEIEKSAILSAVERNVPRKFVELNRKAFQLGYEAVKE